MIQKKNINQEETDEDKETEKTNFPENMVARSHVAALQKEVMFCYFCQKSKRANPFALAEGCTNFRTSTLQRLKDCKEHDDAVNEEAMRDTFSNTQRCVFTTIIFAEMQNRSLVSEREFTRLVGWSVGQSVDPWVVNFCLHFR